MGVEDEFGENIPNNRVLNNKKPLNFILEEPTHLKYIDATLGLHAALGERLIQNYLNTSQTSNSNSSIIKCENPPSDLEKTILMTTLQNGIIKNEILKLLNGFNEN